MALETTSQESYQELHTEFLQKMGSLGLEEFIQIIENKLSKKEKNISQKKKAKLHNLLIKEYKKFNSNISQIDALKYSKNIIAIINSMTEDTNHLSDTDIIRFSRAHLYELGLDEFSGVIDKITQKDNSLSEELKKLLNNFTTETNNKKALNILNQINTALKHYSNNKNIIQINTQEQLSTVPIIQEVQEHLKKYGLPEFITVVGNLKLTDKNIVLLKKVLATKDTSQILHIFNGISQKNTSSFQPEQKYFDTINSLLSQGKNRLSYITPDSYSLNRIESIWIEGSSDKKEFYKNLEKYIKTIIKMDEFKKLSKEKQEIFLNNIRNFGKIAEKKEKYIHDEIENYYDSLARDIENQPNNGRVTLKLNNGIIPFADKSSAFNLIKAMKKEAEWQFQSTSRNLWESAGALVSSPLGILTDILTIPYKITSNSYGDLYNSINENDPGSQIAANAIMAFFMTVVSLNYTETLYTRIYLDTFGKMSINVPRISSPLKLVWNTTKGVGRLLLVDSFKSKKKDKKKTENNSKDTEKTENNSKDTEKTENKIKDTEKAEVKTEITKNRSLIIPDYAKIRQNNPQFIPDKAEASLYNEYIQRMHIMDQLHEEMNTKTGKEKILYEAEYNKVKELLNVNTRSFYLDAIALKKGIFTPKKLYWAIRNGVIPWKFTKVFAIPFFTQDLTLLAGTEFNVKNDILKNELTKGLQFVFDGDIELKEKNGLIDGTKSGENVVLDKKIQYIEAAIHSNDTLSSEEKNKRIQRIHDYIESLKTFPQTENTIKQNLYAFAWLGKISRFEAESIIEEALKKAQGKDRDFLKDTTGWLEQLTKTQKQELQNLFSKAGYKTLPSFLTKGQVALLKIHYYITNDIGEYTEKELRKTISDSLTDKIEFRRIYPGLKGKAHFGINTVQKVFHKLISGTPITYTQLIKYFDGHGSDDLKKILDIGESSFNRFNNSKEMFSKGLGKNLSIIFDLDSNKFDSKSEKFFEEIFSQMQQKIKDSELKLTPEQLKIEFIKMYNGFLPTFKALEIIEHSISTAEERNNPKIKKLISDIETNKKLVTTETLNTLIKNPDINSKGTTYKSTSKVNTDGSIEMKQSVDRHSIPSLKEFLDNKSSSVKQEIESIEDQGEKLGKEHFKNAQFGIFNGENLNEKLLTEIRDYARIINYRNSSININSKFNSILGEINSGIDFTYEEFFEKLKKDLSINTSKIDKNITLKDFHLDIKQQCKSIFLSLPLKERSVYRTFIKENGINKDILPDEIKTFLEQEKEEKIKTENLIKTDKLIKTQIAELERIKTELPESSDKKEIKELKKEFNNYIKDEKIDRTSTEFKKLIEEFKSEYNRKYSAFEGNGGKGKSTSEKTKTRENIIEKIKNFSNLYDRAILQALVSNDIKLAQELSEEKNNKLKEPKNIDINGLEEALKSRVGGKKLFTERYLNGILNTRLKINGLKAELQKEITKLSIKDKVKILELKQKSGEEKAKEVLEERLKEIKDLKKIK